MPDTTSSTELTSQYTAQVIGDLDRNTKEQERIGAEIDALQEQLNALRHDHSVLTSLHQALGVTEKAAPTKAVKPAAPSVPQQKSAAKATKATSPAKAAKATKTTDAKGTRSRAKTAGSAKDVASKTVAAKASDAKAGDAKTGDAKSSGTKAAPAKKPAAKAVSGQPTLVELIRGYLTAQGEPRSAAEVSTALGKTHPDRRIQTNVVRTTLENLVAKSHAHRAKQGASVFYTATDGHEPAATAASTEQPVEASAG
ncbi:hypothetical protein OHB33_05045 [Streptomyces sp. NBC_01558]|uniref:hypothetical protein n=1 Tax=Streptomyces sp. NBC_01558 TaxID=2975878 RepID=UPI002DDB7B55|nr:hypothetical protein [Streptomyces sp. NBC_01558]WSD75724.1 hypothetical protein OHB33_05045 [Streptomyces sp. NBC_01558]